MNLFTIAGGTGAIASLLLCFQPPADRPRGGPPEPPNHAEQAPHAGPFLDLFDTDRSGDLSSAEIGAATTVLKKLDLNKDGRLTREELPRPPHPGEHGDHRPPRRDGLMNGEREQAGPTRGMRPSRAGNDPGGPPRQRRQRPEADDAVDISAPKGTVTLVGGFETNPIDNGRPVNLIAGALAVKPEVFRDAFRNVRPASNGAPTDTRAMANKKVLMQALGKHGISNDRLDAVSNYYRYQPGQGERWPHTVAKVKAVVRNGEVVGLNVVAPGAGYTTAPTVVVAGYPNARFQAELSFSENFNENGSIKSFKIVR